MSAITNGIITTRNIPIQWNSPDGVVEYYQVDCGNGVPIVDLTVYPNEAVGGLFTVDCAVPTAGLSYTITVASWSGDKKSETSASFTAASE